MNKFLDVYHFIFNFVMVVVIWGFSSLLFIDSIKAMHEVTKVIWAIIPALAGLWLLMMLLIKWKKEENKKEGDK